MLKRILIIGHARHGKDTAAEMLRDLYGLSFKSSSLAAAEIFLYDTLKDQLGYHTPQECYEDRVNHRKLWHDLICEYNEFDKARLAKGILATSDMYVGMRDSKEIMECKFQGLFDLIIGIYDPRKPEEGKDSFDIDLHVEADIIVPNSGTLQDLRNRLTKIKPLLFKAPAYTMGYDPYTDAKPGRVEIFQHRV